MKLIGMIALTMASVVYGITQSTKLYKRVELLLLLEKAVDEIKAIIRYSAQETDEIIYRIRQKYPALFTENVVDEDAEIINELINGIGKTDSDGQLAFCEGINRIIERNLREAEADKQEKAKLYAVLGLSFGLAFSIILV